MRTYTELLTFGTFEERLAYLCLFGRVGSETFGFERYLNQTFYHSKQWKEIRDFIIVRDLGCDLALPGYEIPSGASPLIHHLNPISAEDIRDGASIVYDPEFLVLTTYETHNMIHYGKNVRNPYRMTERFPNDTCPWRIS